MNISTKFGAGDIVCAVHPCRVICGGQIILDEGMPGVEINGLNQKQTCTDDIYIVSPYEVRNITASCSKGFKTEIMYELSNGVIRKEKDVFASFEDAAEYAVGLYEKSAGKYNGSGKYVRTDALKEMICHRLRQSLKAVLSYDQLERFEEEFVNATQGLVFREA